MWTDAVDLRDFYGSGLGKAAQRMIRNRVRAAWPEVKGLAVLGLGYTTPYLGVFRGEAARVMAAMPAQQGVLPWPRDGPSLTALVDEQELPFPDLSIDRVLLVHALESAVQVRPMLREVWRVLSGAGRLLAVVPNRRGLWARFERTPFGLGEPYSQAQLSRLLRETMFTPLASQAALFVPPVRSRMVLSAAGAWEEVGQRAFTTFAGVILAEAAKQIYAAGTQVAERKVRAYIPQGQRRPAAVPGD